MIGRVAPRRRRSRVPHLAGGRALGGERLLKEQGGRPEQRDRARHTRPEPEHIPSQSERLPAQGERAFRVCGRHPVRRDLTSGRRGSAVEVLIEGSDSVAARGAASELGVRGSGHADGALAKAAPIWPLSATLPPSLSLTALSHPPPHLHSPLLLPSPRPLSLSSLSVSLLLPMQALAVVVRRERDAEDAAGVRTLSVEEQV